MQKGTSYNKYVRYYSNTSSAVQVDEAKPRRRTERRTAGAVRKPAPKKRHRSRGKILFKHIEDNIAGISVYYVVTIAIIFLGIVAMLGVSAAIRRNQLDISELRAELRKHEEETATIKVEMAEKYDVAHIEEVATTRLGMSKPKPYQMVYINVPKESYVVQHTRVTDVVLPEELSIFERISGIVVSLYTKVQLGIWN